MARRVSVKCAITGCHYQRKITLSEREELRRVGRENNATAGLMCPAHVRAAFNFEFEDIDIDVPLEELLVEAAKDTPRWRVMLTPLPGAAGETDSQSTQGAETRLSNPSAPADSSRENSGNFRVHKPKGLAGPLVVSGGRLPGRSSLPPSPPGEPADIRPLCTSVEPSVNRVEPADQSKGIRATQQ